MKHSFNKNRNTYLYAITGSIFLILAVFFSCKKQKAAVAGSQKVRSTEQPSSTAAPKTESSCGSCSAVWTPRNTTVKQVSAGNIHILNSNQYRYIGVSLNGQIVTGLSGVSMSCTCTAGSGGCNPVKSGDNYGCVLGTNCTACSGSKGGIIAGTAPGEFQTVALKSGGFISRNIEVHFATKSELLEQAYFFPAMTGIPEINEAVRNFKVQYGGKDSVRTLVSVAGRIAILQVDRKMAELSHASVLSAKASCSCTDGTCVAATYWGSDYCDAKDCKGTCTLSTGLKVDGKPLQYQCFQF